MRLYRDLQLFFRERGKGKVVVTIRIPKRELTREENVLLAELPIEEEQQQEQNLETEVSEATAPAIILEEGYVLVEIQGESHHAGELFPAACCRRGGASSRKTPTSRSTFFEQNSQQLVGSSIPNFIR